MSIGKLYRFSDGQFVSEIRYRLFNHESATNWWGELTLVDTVNLDEGDRFIIEFEDERKSECHLKKMVNRAVSGVPPRFIYHFTGFSPVE